MRRNLDSNVLRNLFLMVMVLAAAHCGDSAADLTETDAGVAVSCSADRTACGTRCVDVAKDPAYCGSCTNACDVGHVCSRGECKVACQARLTNCSSSCANLKADRENCGECGRACKQGEVCSSGACLLSCQEGLIQCGDLCVDPLTDRDHCGKCAAACKSGELCSLGSCTVSCQASLTNCDDLCVNLLSSRDNCGKCSAACALGQVCSSGACALSCQKQLTNCNGTCADLRSDNAHCGECSSVCKSGHVCSEGSCEISCQQGLSLCDGLCVNLTNDNFHCGTCTKHCESGQICASGACEVSCLAATVECNGVCIDPLTSRFYCGASADCAAGNAGRTCAEGQVCYHGACMVTCQQGLVNCGGQCTDPKTSLSHCGSSGDCTGAQAGKTCGAGEVCSNGACAVSCQQGLIVCDGVCTNPRTSPTHCGASGNCQADSAGAPCPSGQVCSNGACAVTCQTGLVNCAGVCTDPTTSLDHCGAKGDCQGANAGSLCAAGQVCSSGACAVSCQQGLVNCNGICTDPMKSFTHCGASGSCGADAGSPGTACAAGQVCSAGICSLSCQQDLINCNGRCIDPKSDPLHCGASSDCDADGGTSGIACASGWACVEGVCLIVCPTGQTPCGGACFDLRTDPRNCGSCGYTCGSSSFCQGGGCAASCSGSNSPCSGSCVDLMTDPTHCGACGRECPSGATCQSGICACPAGSGFCNNLCTLDQDGDGFGSGKGLACDCNDKDKTILPNTVGTCTQVDNNCDGVVNDSWDVALHMASMTTIAHDWGDPYWTENVATSESVYGKVTQLNYVFWLNFYPGGTVVLPPGNYVATWRLKVTVSASDLNLSIWSNDGCASGGPLTWSAANQPMGWSESPPLQFSVQRDYCMVEFSLYNYDGNEEQGYWFDWVRVRQACEIDQDCTMGGTCVGGACGGTCP
jgi:hypothetical protein